MMYLEAGTDSPKPAEIRVDPATLQICVGGVGGSSTGIAITRLDEMRVLVVDLNPKNASNLFRAGIRSLSESGTESNLVPLLNESAFAALRAKISASSGDDIGSEILELATRVDAQTGLRDAEEIDQWAARAAATLARPNDGVLPR